MVTHARARAAQLRRMKSRQQNQRLDWDRAEVQANARRVNEIVVKAVQSAEERRLAAEKRLAAYVAAEPAACELALARTLRFWGRFRWAWRWARRGVLEFERRREASEGAPATGNHEAGAA